MAAIIATLSFTSAPLSRIKFYIKRKVNFQVFLNGRRPTRETMKLEDQVRSLGLTERLKEIWSEARELF
jgi:hypothetical protein